MASTTAASVTVHPTTCIHALGSFSTNEWIADSGASLHITGNASQFSSLHKLSNPFNVRVADGSLSPITAQGIVPVSETLSLHDVLHAPEFALSLLSISQITKALNCRAVFYQSFFVLQNL